MKHFVLVSLLSCFAVGHMDANIAIYDNNHKQAVAKRAAEDGFFLTTAMMCGAASTGLMIAGAKGAFAFGCMVGFVSMINGLRKTMTNNVLSKDQETADDVYNDNFALSQTLTPLCITLIATICSYIYQFGYIDGVIDTRQECISILQGLQN